MELQESVFNPTTIVGCLNNPPTLLYGVSFYFVFVNITLKSFTLGNDTQRLRVEEKEGKRCECHPTSFLSPFTGNSYES